MSGSCCGSSKPPAAGLQETEGPRQPYVSGFIQVGERRVPVVSTRLSARDLRGSWKVRWDIGRMRYAVLPGLYAVGNPGRDSPVLVTANYKLTFDTLRKSCAGIDAWILVLDTKGINVWCAAGKGTFGTEELIERVKGVKLEEVVTHNRLVLPQLGATGVSAHRVLKESRWRVIFGPVRAADIPSFLAAGMKKDDRMRAVRFNLADRMAIAPTELMQGLPILAGLAALSLLGALPFKDGYGARLVSLFVPFLAAILAGTLVFPALLPVIPFKAFSLKGAILGAVWGTAAAFIFKVGLLAGIAMVLIITPVVAFISMNFTGSSTYTCQTGAELEVRRSLVPMVASLVVGVGVFVTQRALGA